MNPASRTEAALLASTFSNTTGFAWTFIFRLQRAVARSLEARGIRIVLSFASIEGPVTVLDPTTPFEALTFDLDNATLPAALRFAAALRRRRVRFLYATDWPTWHWSYPVLRAYGVRRIVVHIHASVPDPALPRPVRGPRRALKAMIQRSPLAADLAIAISDFVALRLTEVACRPRDRVAVIRNGIEVERFACPETAAAGAVRIFLAARATRFKGVQVLIEAARRLAARGDVPPFVVEYAGSGPELEHFRAQAAAAGLGDRFRFLGNLADTLEPLCRADIVVVPSIWGEALGLTVQEGMAAGKAVVASRVGGIPEVTGDEDAAVLVPHGDPDALAEALEGLVGDAGRRHALGARARRRAEREFREPPFHAAVVAAVMAGFGLGRVMTPSEDPTT